MKVKLSRAMKKSGEFVWIGLDPDKLPNHGGTGATRYCSGANDHECSINLSLWQETVKDKDGTDKKQMKTMNPVDIKSACQDEDTCVEKAYLDKPLLCTESHTHTDKCPRGLSVEEELAIAVQRIIDIETANLNEGSLV